MLIADDHAPQRLAVRLALETADFDVVDEAPDAETAYEAALLHWPDICLLDIHCPVAASRRRAES